MTPNVIEVDEFPAERLTPSPTSRGSDVRSAWNPLTWVTDFRVRRLWHKLKVTRAKLYASQQRIEQLEMELDFLAKVVVNNEKYLEASLSLANRLIDGKTK